MLPIRRARLCRLTSPLAVTAILSALLPSLSVAQTTPTSQTQTKKAPVGPPAPQSTHFPILLLAFGASADTGAAAVTPTPATPSATSVSPATVPSWSIRIGQKGPERMDRPGYPPAVLEPVDVTREGTTDTWTYRGKDSATSAQVSVRITREPCVLDASGTKYPFRAEAQHGQIGSLTGCARIAAELFPKISNQTADEDADADEKKTPAVLPADVINFVSPTDYAYIAPSGKIVAALGKIKKIAAAEGTELAFSHDGKKLLYTRSDSKTGPERSIVLYDTDQRPLTGSGSRERPPGVLVARRHPRRLPQLPGSEVAAVFLPCRVARAGCAALRHQPEFPARLDRLAYRARQRHAERVLDSG